MRRKKDQMTTKELEEEQAKARVTSVDRGGFLVRGQGPEQYAELAGKQRSEPPVGDGPSMSRGLGVCAVACI